MSGPEEFLGKIVRHLRASGIDFMLTGSFVSKYVLR